MCPSATRLACIDNIQNIQHRLNPIFIQLALLEVRLQHFNTLRASMGEKCQCHSIQTIYRCILICKYTNMKIYYLPSTYWVCVTESSNHWTSIIVFGGQLWAKLHEVRMCSLTADIPTVKYPSGSGRWVIKERWSSGRLNRAIGSVCDSSAVNQGRAGNGRALTCGSRTHSTHQQTLYWPSWAYTMPHVFADLPIVGGLKRTEWQYAPFSGVSGIISGLNLSRHNYSRLYLSCNQFDRLNKRCARAENVNWGWRCRWVMEPGL